MAVNTFVLDIGKTNIKCVVLDDQGNDIWSRQQSNQVVESGAYPHFDVEAVWQLLLDSLRQAQADVGTDVINISTHGACAVLVDAQGELVLPVMDYEFKGVEDATGYLNCRPAFDAAYSPLLPGGLNIGRQLYWQREHFPEQFANIRTVFMYPQYWAWRLTGVAANEVTSLGCHSDLWLPFDVGYSPLLNELNLEGAMPPLVPADQPLATVRKELAADTGLPETCPVYPGVHDSNASFYCYLSANPQSDFTVVSTGTWIIIMTTAAQTDRLDESADMLVNVNVKGKPIACARFMGGREFEEICRRCDAAPDDMFTEHDIQTLVSQGVLALPAFSDGGGPFHKLEGAIQGPVTPERGAALASLYIALMIDYELDLFGVSGDIYFGSVAQKNPVLCQLIAQLRPHDRVLLSQQGASTVRGAWMLTRGGDSSLDTAAFEVAVPLNISGLDEYRQKWRS